MSENIKVLLLAPEPWRGDVSGGNTIDNFFRGMKGVEFAHVYVSDKLPEGVDVCERYFQLPHRGLAGSFWGRKRLGRALSRQEVEAAAAGRQAPATTPTRYGLKQKLFRWMKNVRPHVLITLKMFMWRFCRWKTPELNQFIKDFQPDVIFAPFYASPFLCAVARHVKRLTGKKMITWSVDGVYSLRVFSLSPFFWLNRFWVRHSLRRTFPCYDEFFSISEDEIEELSPIVGKRMQILRKGVAAPEDFTPRAVNSPVRFIYAGNLYCNRHKSLIALAEALKKVNADGVRAELHIYTGSTLHGKDAAALNDGVNVFNHGLISSHELSGIYQKSDVAIHCESFSLRHRLQTRLSFSTKIIDCFQSGCAILAIAWEEHTGLKCLQKEDAAFCVTRIEDIESMVVRIVKQPELIQEYARKAYECAKRNHRMEDVQATLYDSFVRCRPSS